LETFRWSDRNAPIDISGAGTEDAKIPWEECVKIVEKGVCYIVLFPFHIALFGYCDRLEFLKFEINDDAYFDFFH